MNTVIIINLNGNAFHLEEPGFQSLRAYLERALGQLQDNPDKTEIMADLEQAIADKCAHFLRPYKNVLTAAEINDVLKEMGPVQTDDGAAGPGAYDCSGLVYAAYAAAGIHIARTTYQWQQDGPVVPLSQIQPGDLLFSAGSDGTPANPGHVVMYLGGGQVIQAPQTGEDVQIDPADLASVVVATRPAGLATKP